MDTSDTAVDAVNMNLRLPVRTRDRLKVYAHLTRRSMTATVVVMVEEALDRAETTNTIPAGGPR